MSSDEVEKSNTWARIASLNTEAIVLPWLIFPTDCLGVSTLLSLPFHCLKYNWIFSMPLSREHQDQRERHKVKDFQSPGWYAALRFWQIKITNWGRYHCLILHILTHGSRCVVSAWIPVGNYLSASAHWCHSFPVITQSPACQGQVTSRWAWLVLNWALLPILPTISRQTQHIILWPLCPFTQSDGCYLSTGAESS